MNLTDNALKWALLHRSQCADWNDYVLSVAQDFEQIAPFLPEKVNTILDIGCGLAGIDILLKQKYPDARLMLLDSDGKAENFRGGFDNEMLPFMQRTETERFLESNGVNVNQWLDVGTKETLAADLIISLYSWGWHYPLETYKVKGLAIADLRGTSKGKLIAPVIVNGKHKGNRCAFEC